MKIKKILAILLIALILPVGVFATDIDTSLLNGVEQETVETTPTTEKKTDTDVIDPDMNVPSNSIIDENVTLDDVGNRVLTKLYEVASLLKKMAAPIAIIMFIVGAILMVLGAVGKRDGIKQGVIICVLSIVMYAICMYSQQIVVAVSNWMVS